MPVARAAVCTRNFVDHFHFFKSEELAYSGQGQSKPPKFPILNISMDLIRAPLTPSAQDGSEILLLVERHTLAKRRWRGVAEDGWEFGFDLDEPLRDGAAFFEVGGAIYVISQKPEAVLEIALGAPLESARVGWLIGNLHFSLELAGSVIRVADDSALRQMLTREHIAFSEVTSVFHPERHGHVH